MRIYLYVTAGLLAAATALSLVLDRWDVLIGVAAGLAWVIAGDLFGWRGKGGPEPRKWPDLSQTDDTGRTTYYYDDENAPVAEGSADDVRVQPKSTASEDEGRQQQ